MAIYYLSLARSTAPLIDGSGTADAETAAVFSSFTLTDLAIGYYCFCYGFYLGSD